MLLRVLLVDDDAHILSALQRNLAGTYRVDTSERPAEALEAVRQNAYSVVLSDLQMPGMSGIEFLAGVKEISPDSVRILLTGHADLDTAIAAVNEGNIFRLLTKPCAHATLTQAFDAAVNQYRLIMAEREVLRETLMGTVNLLVEVLSATQPVAFGRTSRIRLYVDLLSREMRMPNLWEVEAAASLSQLGCISVSAGALRKYCCGEDLTADEISQIQGHPYAGAKLLRSIPRMHAVAEIVERQLQPFDALAEPLPENYSITLGVQLLRVAHDFDRFIRHGMSWEQAVAAIELYSPKYNPAAVAALKRLKPTSVTAQRAEPFSDTGLEPDGDQPFRSITDRVLRLIRA